MVLVADRGSFFRPTRRYRTEAQLQTAHDHLRYLRELMREQAEAEPDDDAPDLKAVVCEAYADHDFDLVNDVTVKCRRCGRLYENPAQFWRGRAHG